MTALWGVGTCDDGATRAPWEISHEEIQREMGAAPARLRALGVDAGERVLFCSMLSEAGQFWPLVVGAMLTGAQLSCADANEGDAARVAMFTRLMTYRAALGITGALLDGFEQPIDEVFADVAVVGARPDAYERLLAAGIIPYHFVLCGPALAIGREPGGPAYVDGDEWELDADGDRILITSKRTRATTFDRSPTAVRGVVVDGGVLPHT
jgi:hypothetical protein